MKCVIQTFLLLAVTIAAVPQLQAAPIYATSLVTQQFTTSFGSGIVTGAPDGGGRYLGDTPDPPAHPGFLEVSFATPLYDGPGADIQVFDVFNNANEVVNISVSADGNTFTNVGTLNSVANTLDIAGKFSGPFSYIKIANATTSFSMDVDAVAGLNPVPAQNTAPEPSSIALLAGGLALIPLLKRRAKQ